MFATSYRHPDSSQTCDLAGRNPSLSCIDWPSNRMMYRAAFILPRVQTNIIQTNFYVYHQFSLRHFFTNPLAHPGIVSTCTPPSCSHTCICPRAVIPHTRIGSFPCSPLHLPASPHLYCAAAVDLHCAAAFDLCHAAAVDLYYHIAVVHPYRGIVPIVDSHFISRCQETLLPLFASSPSFPLAHTFLVVIYIRFFF